MSSRASSTCSARSPTNLPGALLGGVIKTEIPIYLSGSERILSAEEEVDIYVRGFAETGANAP